MRWDLLLNDCNTVFPTQSPPQEAELFCPAHLEQPMQGNGKKYYLDLLQPEQLEQRGVNAKKAKLIINAYPVLVLSNEWL